MTDEIRAVLYSDVPPSAEQESRFKQFLKNKYEEDVPSTSSFSLCQPLR